LPRSLNCFDRLACSADNGIAAQRKVDLAARRIGKLITYTQTNDTLRKEYKERATKLRAHLTEVST